jgi:hypothetical protein
VLYSLTASATATFTRVRQWQRRTLRRVIRSVKDVLRLRLVVVSKVSLMSLKTWTFTYLDSDGGWSQLGKGREARYGRFRPQRSGRLGFEREGCDLGSGH